MWCAVVACLCATYTAQRVRGKAVCGAEQLGCSGGGSWQSAPARLPQSSRHSPPPARDHQPCIYVYAPPPGSPPGCRLPPPRGNPCSHTLPLALHPVIFDCGCGHFPADHCLLPHSDPVHTNTNTHARCARDSCCASHVRPCLQCHLNRWTVCAGGRRGADGARTLQR